MSKTNVSIFSIQKFSTEDGPGIRTTVFFKGCSMRCPWCHNPEALRAQPELVWHGGRCIGHRGCVDICPEQALSAERGGIAIDRSSCCACGLCVDACPTSALEIHGRTMTVTEIFDTVMRDAAFYDTSLGGVTLSGGEPLAQPAGALELLRMLQEANVHTALDTCGAASERAFREALKAIDLLLLDIKSVNPLKHERMTGVPFEGIERAAQLARDSGVPVWVRTPIIPGYTDDESELRAIARFVAETLPNCERHDLLAFSNLCAPKYEQLDRVFALEGVPLLPTATMERLCAAALEEGSVHAQWSGPTRLEEVAGA